MTSGSVPATPQKPPSAIANRAMLAAMAGMQASAQATALSAYQQAVAYGSSTIVMGTSGPLAMRPGNPARRQHPAADYVDDPLLQMAGEVDEIRTTFCLTRAETMRLPMEAFILWLAASAAKADGDNTEATKILHELGELAQETLGRTISVSIVPPTHPADVGEDYEP